MIVISLDHCLCTGVLNAKCWDISLASMDLTNNALARLTASDAIKLRLVGLFDAPSGDFDAVIFCEMLDRWNFPARALAKLRAQLAPGGTVFINMPINCPALDHLCNQPSLGAFASFIEAAGFEITDHCYFPATNYILERARANALIINCVFVAKVSSD